MVYRMESVSKKINVLTRPINESKNFWAARALVGRYPSIDETRSLYQFFTVQRIITYG